MTGKEAIVEKILSDARAIANSTTEEATLRGKEIMDSADLDAKIYREKNMKESYAEREEIIRRKITVANLEVKKNILGKKQQLIKKAFDAVVEEIKKDGYVELIKGMLSYAEEGDSVYFSSADKEVFDEKWIEKYIAESKKNISFGGYGNFVGGIVISGNGNDKNFSLEVELKSVRDEFEPKIATLLFGE